MSKRVIIFTFPILLVLGIYFMGPEPDKPLWNKEMPTVPLDPFDLDKYVASQEAKHKLKLDNEARIIWVDSLRKQTDYSVVYIHGFHASQEEGDPVHEQFAITFGCNLYLARLADHGVDTVEQLVNYTVDRQWQSAKEALAIGKALGKKVIVMSTSSGSTLSLMLAATYPEDVYALINLSPNIAIKRWDSFIANKPWGLQIARMVIGDKSIAAPKDSLTDQYWNNPYRLEAGVQLKEMVDDKMGEKTFKAVKCPSLTLYYYKNEQEQDQQVKVSAILEMNKQLGTPDSLKMIVPVPNAGDHVIGCYITSKDVETVAKEIQKFAMEKLKMKPVVVE